MKNRTITKYCIAIVLGASMLPPTAEETRAEDPNSFYQTLAKSAEGNLDIAKSVQIICTIVQMSSPKDRQDFITQGATGIQNSTRDQRMKALAATAQMWKSGDDAKRQSIMSNILHTLSMLTPVERQIVAVQAQKLVAETASLPKDQAQALLPAFATVIKAAEEK